MQAVHGLRLVKKTVCKTATLRIVVFALDLVRGLALSFVGFVWSFVVLKKKLTRDRNDRLSCLVTVLIAMLVTNDRWTRCRVRTTRRQMKLLLIFICGVGGPGGMAVDECEPLQHKPHCVKGWQCVQQQQPQR